MATEPTLRVDKVRHKAHLIYQENAQCGARNVISVVIKTILVLVVGQSRKALSTSKRPPHGRSTIRHPKDRGRWYKSRSRSRSNTQSAHSIELNSFQDHPQLHGWLSWNVHERLTNDLHGRHSFEDPEERTYYVSKTFHTIYRSKLVSSTSNKMDPDGKTKILTILNIKLPHWNGIDKLWVKVDNGAEANILPLDSFRTMFPHALDKNSYSKTGFLERSKINLECYNDRRLINHGCIKLKLQHCLEKSFQDHIFYVIETKTWKEIIIGHPVSVRLGLICVLCKNVSKSMSAI